MRPSMKKEDSWAMLDTSNHEPNFGVQPNYNVAGQEKSNTLKTLSEDHSTRSFPEPSEFQPSQATPTKSDSSKAERRQQMKRMSSWACLGIDDLCLSMDDLCSGMEYATLESED